MHKIPESSHEVIVKAILDWANGSDFIEVAQAEKLADFIVAREIENGY
jgi:predicted nicotinamide N-methyase